ncbi:MAG: methyltransferase domain-containing protein, partial [Propionicimonas sp.]
VDPRPGDGEHRDAGGPPSDLDGGAMDELDARAGLDLAFDRAAARYDLLTGLNPGYHRHLAAAADALAGRLRSDPAVLLDLGCGSGSSTAALARAIPRARIIGVDASAGMLARARAKPWPARIDFVHAPAQRLPDLGLPRADGVMAAYLLRNLSPDDRDAVLASIHAELRPGGWLVVQEYSVAGRPLAVLTWDLVCWLVVIPLSWLVRGSPRLDRDLWRSVRGFDTADQVAARLAGAGFDAVEHRRAGGWQRGVLHTFLARRPFEGTQDAHRRTASR